MATQSIVGEKSLAFGKRIVGATATEKTNYNLLSINYKLLPPFVVPS